METQTLSFERRTSYDILLGKEILTQTVTKLSRMGFCKRCVVLSNDVVAKWHLQPLIAELRTRRFEVVEIIIPDGENQKTLDSAAKIYSDLFEKQFDRSGPLITIGGGVIGDLGGFVAATFKRGIPFIQFPTSLLAMVDASIGGKVAVNCPEGKNLIGTFYQPSMVSIDVSYLLTLPLTQLSYGLVEAVKHGIIADAAYYKFILKNRNSIKAKEMLLLQRLVRRSLNIKKEIVEQDELDDKGVRATLNFGHSFGHAFELLGQYRRFHHGEAVGIGMLVAVAFAKELRILKEDFSESLREFLQDFNLPTEIPKEWTSDEIATAMVQDKKRQDQKLHLILPTALGKVEYLPIEIPEIKRILQTIHR